jgi:hypothetical protein
MITKKTALLFSVFALIIVAFTTSLPKSKKIKFKWQTPVSNFVAGNDIQLVFLTQSKTAKPKLFIIHDYGKTILNGKYNNGKISFILPDFYAKKAGVVSWFLINDTQKCLEGTFEIYPNDKTETKIENYLGPPSILAGGSEYTMMVTIPTDSYDNPKRTNTPTLIKHQFLENITVDLLKTKDFIAWKNIYSPNKSGKLLVSTQCDSVAVKEIETEVYPNIATNFTIFFSRNHEFADGNQITDLNTSLIKDAYGNTVSDGTLVSFIIRTKNNYVLKTFGTTIKGIASAKMLHPDHKETYTIKGYVTGIAESNSLIINYKPIISNFNYNFSNKNRVLTVGPLKSFMNQIVPDGIRVVVKIYHNNKLVDTELEESSKGVANFYISKDFYKEKTYRFEITTLGITKKTSILNYDIN